MIINNVIIKIIPIKPNSSLMIEKIKSVCGSGRKKCFWMEFPNPVPRRPLGPIAYSDCIIWKPLPKGSSHGFIKEIILFNLYGAMIIKPIIPINPIIPNFIKKFILTPDMNNNTIIVITMIIPVPKSG